MPVKASKSPAHGTVYPLHIKQIVANLSRTLGNARSLPAVRTKELLLKRLVP